MVRIITSDITVPAERGKYLGGISAVWGLSSTLGGFVGGAIITVVSWRAIFLVNIPIGAVAGFMLYSGLNVPKKQGKSLQEHRREFDLLGLLLIGGGSAACEAGLTGTHANHWLTWVYSPAGSQSRQLWHFTFHPGRSCSGIRCISRNYNHKIAHHTTQTFQERKCCISYGH